MLKQAYHVVLLVLICLGVSASLMWVHSYLVGWESSWSKPVDDEAGRVVSKAGHFYFQHYATLPLDEATKAAIKTRKAIENKVQRDVRAAVTVGSNPNGPWTEVIVGGRSIVFRHPSGQGIGYSYQHHWQGVGFESEGQSLALRPPYRWREFVVSYALIVVLLLLLPLEYAVRRLRRRRSRSARSVSQPAA